MKKYKCVKSFIVDSFDDDGRFEEKQITIKQGSLWYKDDENFRVIDGEIRLIEKVEGYSNWLEVTKETLNDNFEEVIE